MSNCPKCSAEIDPDSFGLVTCASCKSILSVDLDGNATLANEQPPAEEYIPQEALSAPESAYDPISTSDPAATAGTVPELKLTAASMHAPEQVTAPVLTPELEPMPTFTPESMTYTPESHQTFEFSQVNQLIQSAEEVSTTSANQSQGPISGLQGFNYFKSDASPSAKEIFKEIAEFAKAPPQPTLLSYSLVIEGISTEELKNSLIEALSDKKFFWENNPAHTDMINKIVGFVLNMNSNERVEFNNLSPAQTVTLIKRINTLPLKVSWRQEDGML